MRKPIRRKATRAEKGQLSAKEIEIWYIEIARHRAQAKPKRCFLPKARTVVYEYEL